MFLSVDERRLRPAAAADALCTTCSTSVVTHKAIRAAVCNKVFPEPGAEAAADPGLDLGRVALCSWEAFPKDLWGQWPEAGGQEQSQGVGRHSLVAMGFEAFWGGGE